MGVLKWEIPSVFLDALPGDDSVVDSVAVRYRNIIQQEKVKLILNAFYVFYFPMDFYINGNFRGFNLDFSGTYHTTEAALIKG